RDPLGSRAVRSRLRPSSGSQPAGLGGGGWASGASEGHRSHRLLTVAHRPQRRHGPGGWTGGHRFHRLLTVAPPGRGHRFHRLLTVVPRRSHRLLTVLPPRRSRLLTVVGYRSHRLLTVKALPPARRTCPNGS